MPPGPIMGPSAWRGAELARSEEWMVRLSPTDVAELEAALEGVRRRGIALEDSRKADFPPFPRWCPASRRSAPS